MAHHITTSGLSDMSQSTDRHNAHGRLHTGAALLAIGLLATCAPQGTRLLPSIDYGYLVLNHDGRRTFNAAHRDTVPEVPPGQVPSNVVAAADSQAHLYRKDPSCNRFFAGDQLYLVLFASSCRAAEYLEDGRALAGYTVAGRPKGRSTLWPSNFVSAVKPSTRTH